MERLINVSKPNTRCFAYDELKGECRCLKETYCTKERCNFYRTKDELDWTNLENATKMYGYKTLKDNDADKIDDE